MKHNIQKRKHQIIIFKSLKISKKFIVEINHLFVYFYLKKIISYAQSVQHI
jgi:hypothetical protein